MSTEHLSGFLQWLEQTVATETLAAVPDHELLERFLTSHDEASFRVIISRHGLMVYRVCHRVLPDEQDTEDAFQAAFLVLVRKAGSIHKRKSLASWLHGVAYQVALRLRTSSQRRCVREARAGSRDEVVAGDDRSWREVRAILDEELSRLPERLRSPLVLCYLEGLTQDEAAEQLGQTKRTLRRYLERGRALLGTRLTQRGLALSGALMTTLISECVVAMPPGLAASTVTLGEAVRAGKLTTLSPTLTTLTDEVVKTMFPNQLNLKWMVVALLGMGLGSVAIGSLFAEGQSREADDKGIPSRKTQDPIVGIHRFHKATNLELQQQTMSPEIIKAWEKAGAEYGHIRFQDEDFYFETRTAKEGDLPGFSVTGDLKLSELPVPNVPFGLIFSEITDAGLKEITAFKRLETLVLMSTEVTDAGLKELVPLKQLKSLELACMKVTDEGLKQLATFKQLKSLNVMWPRVTDTGIKEIAALNQLQSLHLSGLTDVGVKELAPLKQLRTLSSDVATVTDAGLKELAALDQLQTLKLPYAPVTDNGLKELVALKGLQTLHLRNALVTDEGLKEIAKLKQLQSLNLMWTKVTDAGLKELAALKQLQSLNLSYTELTGMGLAELAPLKHLHNLELVSTKVADAGAKEIAALKQLQSLNLNATKVTDTGVKELATLKQLESLELGGTQVTDEGLKEIATLKQLQTLQLGDTQVTDAGMKELAPLKQLQALYLHGTRVTDVGLKELASFKEIWFLQLSGTKLTDAGLKELANFKQLRSLALKNTKVTDAGMKELANFKQLRQVDLRHTSVTDAGVDELQKALPKCYIWKPKE
jgi:internalin A